VRAGDFGAYGHDSVTMGDSVLFVSQKGIDVYDRKKAVVVKGPRFGVYWPRIVSCAPHSLAAVIETDDRSNYAVRMIDLSKKKPSAGKKLFKKSDAKAWCLEGNRLWLLLGADSKKGERVSLGAVALPECDEVTPFELPGDLPWREVAWMRVSGDRVTALFDDGTLVSLGA
jgi:hypothetical protein